MPDPFNAIVNEDGEIVKYVCVDCGNKYKEEDS
jgi:hypothetical protein